MRFLKINKTPHTHKNESSSRKAFPFPAAKSGVGAPGASPPPANQRLLQPLHPPPLVRSPTGERRQRTAEGCEGEVQPAKTERLRKAAFTTGSNNPKADPGRARAGRELRRCAGGKGRLEEPTSPRTALPLPTPLSGLPSPKTACFGKACSSSNTDLSQAAPGTSGCTWKRLKFKHGT